MDLIRETDVLINFFILLGVDWSNYIGKFCPSSTKGVKKNIF